MIQRVTTRCCAFKEIKDGAYHSLQRNLAIRRRFWQRCHQRRDPVANPRCHFYLYQRISTVFVRRILIRGTRFVALVKPSQREAICRTPPTGFGTSQQTSGLSRGESFAFFAHSEVARLKQATEMAGRKIRFDPVAKSDQRSTRTGKGGGDAWPKRHRPIVAECLLPDQRHVSIRRAGDFDLIQRHASSENPAEDFLDLRFTAAGVE